MQYVIDIPQICAVSKENFDAFFSLIEELADFEHLSKPSFEAKQRLFIDCTESNSRIEAYLIYSEKKTIGYTIIFYSYSSFLAKPSLYLEDIYVQPEFRSKGIGAFIMKFLAKKAMNSGCGRMEWVVLDWNTSAQIFYENLGAVHMKEWFPYRMDESALQILANT